ncbi:MAG: NUDIX domain-containing protein [Candidatus Zambryskibacteria bacterium]|nr:NUDIX domain-containing protein [Candidatus Zambryskibacteria bacterium]
MQHQFCPNGASVVYSNSQGHFPVVRDRWTGRWQLPGGGVEIDESYDEAAVREFYEETGLAIFEDELVHIADFVQRVRNPTLDTIVTGNLRLYVVERVYGGLRYEANSEILEVRYMSFKEIMSNQGDFNIAYVRLLLHYRRWVEGRTPVSFSGALSEKIELSSLELCRA